MAVLNDIRIGFELRPCFVFLGGESRKALFHCWTQRKNSLPNPNTRICALVETEDGQLHTVDYVWMAFLDSKGKFGEFDFSSFEGGTTDAAD